jgi:hypothetical protein
MGKTASGGADREMAGILGGMGVGDTQLFTERFENHPSPQPSPQWGEGEREPIFIAFKREFDSSFQVDVA